MNRCLRQLFYSPNRRDNFDVMYGTSVASNYYMQSAG